MIKNKFIVVQDWMWMDLKLKGSELLLYAVIYGFSQDGNSEFYGSLSYIERFFGVSRVTANNSIRKLIKRGYVLRTSQSHYVTSKETLPVGSKETLLPTSKETLPVASKETLLNKDNTNYNILEKNKNFSHISDKEVSPNNEEKRKQWEKKQLELLKEEKLLMAKKTLADSGIRAVTADKHVPDFNPPSNHKKEQRRGWQVIYDDLVKWLQLEFDQEIPSHTPQLKALCLLRQKIKHSGNNDFVNKVKLKTRLLGKKDWIDKPDFPLLVSQWHKLGKSTQQKSIW